MPKKTKVTIVLEKLDSLKKNESFSKEDFIKKHWGDYDFFMDRSFCVAFTNAKKQIPLKTFKTNKGIIKRIK